MRDRATSVVVFDSPDSSPVARNRGGMSGRGLFSSCDWTSCGPFRGSLMSDSPLSMVHTGSDLHRLLQGGIWFATPFYPCIFYVTVDWDTPGIPQVSNVNDV